VIKEEDSNGSDYGEGSRDDLVLMVNSGNADIGVTDVLVTKERSEVVAYTDALGLIR
jgi:hypothetical protein